MRIAEVSTLARPVPPQGEGSVESLVSAVTEGLVARGHEVTLYALVDSKTTARLRSPVSNSYREDPAMWDWQIYEALNVREAFREFRDYDIIHVHAYHHGLMFCDFVPVPSLHSIHTEPGPDILRLARMTRNRHLLFASQWQARDFHDLPGIHVIPHALSHIPETVFPHREREDYLLFLGRFIPEKGPLEAIEFARRTNRRIVLAAPENDYYRAVIARHVDGRQVQYAGEVGGDRKHELLARAEALIYPVQNPEPFGLVLIEAMAFGTPVLALRKGAVPGIVTSARLGIVADTMDQIAERFLAQPSFDARVIHHHARQHFSPARMLDQLEQLMLQIVTEGVPCP